MKLPIKKSKVTHSSVENITPGFSLPYSSTTFFIADNNAYAPFSTTPADVGLKFPGNDTAENPSSSSPFTTGIILNLVLLCVLSSLTKIKSFPSDFYREMNDFVQHACKYRCADMLKLYQLVKRSHSLSS